jgi:hypothetical protein
MSDRLNPLDPTANASTDDEDRMRQALGRLGDQSSGRPALQREQHHRAHRFVRDGEVPVVVLNSSRERGPDSPAPANRLAAAEAALRAERATRARTERSLRDTGDLAAAADQRRRRNGRRLLGIHPGTTAHPVRS